MSKIIVNGKEYLGGGGGGGGVSNFTETVLATASSFSDMTVDFSTAYDAFVFYANDAVFQKAESYFFTRSEITDAINNNIAISFYPYGSAGICQYYITRSGLTRAKNSAGYFIYKIIGLNFGSTPHIYSTNEQVIGTWVDGKPLYEKTVSFTTGNSDAYLTYDTGIENPEMMSIDFSASFYVTGDAIVNATPYFGTLETGDSNVFETLCNKVDNKIRLDYRVGSSAYSKSTLVTIRYTKTTD